jgi:hypothetical protein
MLSGFYEQKLRELREKKVGVFFDLENLISLEKKEFVEGLAESNIIPGKNSNLSLGCTESQVKSDPVDSNL